MNKKRVIQIIICVVILCFIALIIYFIINNKKTRELEKELVNITTNYYNNEFTEYMPRLLKRNGTLKITVSSLKQLKKDVSIFEDNNCDLENTYVILTYNDKDNYDVESHLSCK